MTETLIGALIGAGCTLLATALHHRYDNVKEKRSVRREKLERAVSAAEQTILSLKWAGRDQFSLLQTHEPSNSGGALQEELQRMTDEDRRRMEESVLELKTLCKIYFPDDEVDTQVTKLAVAVKNAFASQNNKDERHEEEMKAKAKAEQEKKELLDKLLSKYKPELDGSADKLCVCRWLSALKAKRVCRDARAKAIKDLQT